jgi:hypothetical protein
MLDKTKISSRRLRLFTKDGRRHLENEVNAIKTSKERAIQRKFDMKTETLISVKKT